MPLRLNDSVTLVIDIHKWMSETGRFSGVRATGREWIQACCVFHDDSHASFAVNAENGAYVCKGCGASGSFVALVKHVEGHASFDDAESDLIARYGRFVPDVDEALELDFGDGGDDVFVDSLPDDWVDNSTWLEEKRGITAYTQSCFNVGYATMRDAVAMPWCDEKGRVVTIKYRQAGDKAFWYEPRIDNGRLKRLLFGLVQAQNSDMIVVCEGEIDAMSVAQAGYAAVALGGATFHDAQATLLRNSKASEIVVFTDNDDAGRKVRAAIVDKLVGHKRVSCVDWSMFKPTTIDATLPKDANDVLIRHGDKAIRAIIANRIPVGLSLSF